MVSIEKAVLADVCLGVPLGRIAFTIPANLDIESLPRPDCLIYRSDQLALMQLLYRRREPQIREAVDALRQRALEAMKDPASAVTDKPRSRLSRNPHDYQSLAKYWWPNPDSSDGLPYRNRDGDVNPECYADDFDYRRLVHFAETLNLLTLAAYLSGDSGFAHGAVDRLRVWLLDPETRQTPHFDYSQRVPGDDTPRGAGTIESRQLIYVAECVRLLHSMGSLDTREYQQIRDWFRQLLGWMERSAPGQKAALAKNNIGYWYDLQRMVYADLCGDTETIGQIIRSGIVPRLINGTDPDGSQPLELRRAFPHDYVAFSVAAMALISRVADQTGAPLWDVEQGDGRSFQAAHDWLLDATGPGALLDHVASPSDAGHEDAALSGSLFELGVRNRILQRVARHESAAAAAASRERDEQRTLALTRSEEISRLMKESQLVAAERASLLKDLKAAGTERASLLKDLKAAGTERASLLKDLKAAEADRASACAEAKNLKEEQAAAAAHLSALARYQSKLEAYADKLERGFEATLYSRSWRLLSIPRSVANRAKSLLTGKPHRREGLPERPSREDFLRAAPALGKDAQQKPKKTPKASSRALPQAVPKSAATSEPAHEAGDQFASANDPYEALRQARPKDERSLKALYHDSGLDRRADDFVLYRIIGNDLYPRHAIGQSRQNVEFVLDHEPKLANCECRWVVNRIVDPEEEGRIIALLEARSQPYLHIPFDPDEYRRIGWDFDCLPTRDYLIEPGVPWNMPRRRDRLRTALFRLKNLYVMNNNGARNAALTDGLGRAKWVLPWDGNCFLTGNAWHAITADVNNHPHLKYFAVPMHRALDNAGILENNFKPLAVEEPQLIFRCDAAERFNDEFPYGRRPKVELFWRLGMPGPWDSWRDDPWDLHRRELSVEAHAFGVAGWVVRMYSGAKQLEGPDKASFRDRGLARQEAIWSAIAHIDALACKAARDDWGLTFYPKADLDRLKSAFEDAVETPGKGLAERIIADADLAMSGGILTVTEKTTLPPSGDPHDYWHPAPYWWPDPTKPDGLPYIKKDGQRVPGTRLYDPESNRYDRTRLQMMFDRTSALALAWYLTGDARYADKAAKLVRGWFIDPNTRMNPHLKYAQVRFGHNGNEGHGRGIIEFKDIYFLLDAIRLVERAGALKGEERAAFRGWLEHYVDWIRTSVQGESERRLNNNHATYYDLQEAAILAYLGDNHALRDSILRAFTRIPDQITPDGEQPHEMTRTLTQHYCFFNLQGWVNILLLARSNGIPTDCYDEEPTCRVAQAARWLLAKDVRGWPFPQTAPFDPQRVFPLRSAAERLGFGDLPPLAASGVEPEGPLPKAVFDPHDAIHPYWSVVEVGSSGAGARALDAPIDGVVDA
jgi:hypothetical protein